MSVKVVGQVLIMFAFLLAVAGIVEPSAAVSAATAVLAFAGFAIVTHESHRDWAAGYETARAEVTVERPRKSDWDITKDKQVMFKCGQEGCACEHDPRYVVSH